eukprot:TRINITY_DN1552_c0_g1_i2.p1 TRINITY_DN1552_c0_g1~~TRINITY_DN1552_c0_g1_i2.p1  ORF type:complete len:143 (-),score=28.50 TRINITY_DN1552_c0_g1_i2:95-523(-)
MVAPRLSSLFLFFFFFHFLLFSVINTTELVKLKHGEIEETTKTGYWAVEFHKGEISPQFRQLYEEMKGLPNIHFGHHDCKHETSAEIEEHVIVSYPALRLRVNGVIYHFYDKYEVPLMRKFVEGYKEAIEAVDSTSSLKDEL